MPKPIARSKTSGTGKVLRSHAKRRHLLSAKNAKSKRHLAKSAVVDKTDVRRIKANLPFA
jgi:large subunit ribosomal protein L35